ncbi:hypothetical protein C8Q72DRAFT_867527, partial [Fomitopsis betulina]
MIAARLDASGSYVPMIGILPSSARVIMVVVEEPSHLRLHTLRRKPCTQELILSDHCRVSLITNTPPIIAGNLGDRSQATHTESALASFPPFLTGSKMHRPSKVTEIHDDEPAAQGILNARQHVLTIPPKYSNCLPSPETSVLLLLVTSLPAQD